MHDGTVWLCFDMTVWVMPNMLLTFLRRLLCSSLLKNFFSLKRSFKKSTWSTLESVIYDIQYITYYMFKRPKIENVIKLVHTQIFRHQLCRYIQPIKPTENEADLFVCKKIVVFSPLLDCLSRSIGRFALGQTFLGSPCTWVQGSTN